MTEEQWFYVRDHAREGPLSRKELQRLFHVGALDQGTLVWAPSLENWTPAAQVPEFLPSEPVQPLPVPVQNAPTVSPQRSSPPLPILDPDGPQVRPWVRYGARFVDFVVGATATCLVMLLAAPAVLGWPEIALNMIFPLYWVFVESAFLASWGTTPGKWLLRVTVRNGDGSKLTLRQAVTRSFRVWWRGLGTGFPLAELFTNIVAYRKLTEVGKTTWDRDGGHVVTHRQVGVLRGLIASSILVGFVLLVLIGKLGEIQK